MDMIKFKGIFNGLMEIKFLGATETVTGSKHLIKTDGGKQILLDCGLYQGMGKATDELNRHLKLVPSEIDAVILSHSHIDHSGNLPLLVKEGFTGKIYCTSAAKDVSEILLLDSANIHENDITYVNKRRKKEGLPPVKALYTVKDAEKCLKHFVAVPYNADFMINDEVKLKFTEAGHILGSAITNLTLVKENNKQIRLTYTGDIGRYGDMLMKDPESFPQADYIICESTYGDRLHEKQLDATELLLKCVKKTCIEKKGKLIIPAFSLGRTQEIVYTLNTLFNSGRLPKVKIFVDSPLSASATRVMNEHRNCLNEDVQKLLENDPDPFGFEGLKYVTKVEDSKALDASEEPSIIISSSGMMDAGRVKHHLKHCLPDEKNTLLVVGYCSPNSLGAKLTRGEKFVRIFGEDVEVKADVKVITSYSAHADYEEIIRFLECQDKSKVKELFLVHGENDVKVAFKNTLTQTGFKRVTIPVKGESVKLN
jgi:metallo-beta-lactamase family protein